jgi:hypothetical protein
VGRGASLGGAASTPRASEGGLASPGEDLARVDAHLQLPGTPAIVRVDALVDALGLAPSRVERALDRLAEDRERVTKIRAGAYMVRRKPSQDD